MLLDFVTLTLCPCFLFVVIHPSLESSTTFIFCCSLFMLLNICIPCTKHIIVPGQHPHQVSRIVIV
ncbi:unnamed protein product [Amoebophrya sp. A25]|nr:unnamed protein product [Amoebophrya sp. A25]|eukprot:GSA25T00004033001.1